MRAPIITEKMRGHGLEEWETQEICVKDPPFRAKGDGVTDDSLPIQAAFNAGIGRSIYIPHGIYMVANLNVGAGTTLFGDGTLKLRNLLTNQGYPILNIVGNDVTADGLLFNGNKAAQPADGFSDSFDGGAGGLGRAYRAAIKMHYGGSFTKGLTVKNCGFFDCYGSPIATDGISDVRVLNNKAKDNNFELAMLYDTHSVGNIDVLILGNLLENTGSGHATVNSNGFTISNYSGIIVSNNIIKTTERNGIKIEGGKNGVVSNNVILNNSIDNFGGIQTQAASIDLIISDNYLFNTGSGININSTTTQRVSVSRNIINTTIGPSAADGITLGSGGTHEDILINENILHNIKRYGIKTNQPHSRMRIISNSLYGQGSFAGILISSPTLVANLEILNNQLMNFGQAPSSGDGVLAITKTNSGVFTDLIIKNNSIFAGGAANRGLMNNLDCINSGVISDNYIDGKMDIASPAVRIGDNDVSGVVNGTGKERGTIVWDPGNLVDGAGETSGAIAVIGARLGDFALAAAPYDLQGLICDSYVSGADEVKIRLQNETGGAIDLASGTWRVRVLR